MFELLTTDIFAAWFSSLDAGPAEDVAATLDVIVQLGAQREPPGASEALLWYEHPLLAQRPLPDMTSRLAPEIVQFSRDWGRFMGYVRRVAKHLESRAFVARVKRLDASKAALVSASLERIRQVARHRPMAVSELYSKHPAFQFRKPLPHEMAKLARILDETEVREAYFAALAAAGFDVADAPPTPQALREITLRGTPPGLRLLYGIDEPRDRGLVVLGEWLDRSFYGDSVRVAESTWARFLGGETVATQPAEPR